MSLCSVPVAATLPCPSGSPVPLRDSDTSWKESLPWSQCDKHIKTQNTSILLFLPGPGEDKR